MPRPAHTSSATRRWWAVTGSNRRPSRCKRDALPTELTALGTAGRLVRRRQDNRLAAASPSASRRHREERWVDDQAILRASAADLRESIYFLADFLLRLAFSAAPGLKRAFLDAAILISLPVAGLRPFPAARSRTEKVPNPTSRTSSPFLKVPMTPSSTASSAAAAETLVNTASAAIWSTSPSLFIMA